MNAEASTLIIALGGMLATFLASVLPNVMSNRYQAKKDEREFYEKHRCEVIERYLQNTARFLYDNTPQNETSRDYGSALAEIYMYTPEALWPAIDEMNELALAWFRSDDWRSREHNLDQAKTKYRELCKSFSELARSPRSSKNQRKRKTK